MNTNRFSVFTKPWKTQSLDELGDLVRGIGFDAVEYTFRDGYQVQPSDGIKGIVNLAKTLEKHGVAVTSLAAGIDVQTADGREAGIDETVFAGCGEAGIPIIRICQSYDRNLGWHQNMDALKRKYNSIVSYCKKYNVTLGIQMHQGSAEVNCSWDSFTLLKEFDPKYIAAVWDAGHAGLAGEAPRYGLDCIWDHMCMVNFKNAYWYRKNPASEAEQAEWKPYWVTARNGMCNWKDAVDYLKKRGYSGTVCLPAEYTDLPNTETYARQDLKYIKELFAKD
ncbi:MAG: sugar phosphate isomerase/epimerase [Treponema sp.]|nr:sugar phosphate isomerase/epimerase [Treponema sp.]